jgi:hypothetical protein
MHFHTSKNVHAFAAAVILASVMLGCSPSQLAEPEPIPEVIVNDLAAKENALWNAFRQKDRQQLDKFLAYDYMTVGDRGPMDKAAKVSSIDDQNIADFSIRDLQATLLGSNYVLLTYRCSSKGTRHGSSFDQNYQCSDIWISRGGAWQSIFFEDRPLTEQTTATLHR